MGLTYSTIKLSNPKLPAALLQALHQAHAPIHQLNTAQQDQMKTIASTGDGPAALRAKNILRYFYQAPYEDLPKFPPNQTKAGKKLKTDRNEPKSSNGVKVYPNPAKDLVYVEYSMIQDKGKIKITNIMGQSVYVSDFNALASIDVKNWIAGIYTYYISDETGIHVSGTFSINH